MLITSFYVYTIQCRTMLNFEFIPNNIYRDNSNNYYQNAIDLHGDKWNQQK